MQAVIQQHRDAANNLRARARLLRTRDRGGGNAAHIAELHEWASENDAFADQLANAS